MHYDTCEPLEYGEILNASHPQWPLFEVSIHGGKLESMKLFKRLVCGVKHLPLRLRTSFEHDTQRSADLGIQYDPTLMWGQEFLIEGLQSAEFMTQTFETLLKTIPTKP